MTQGERDERIAEFLRHARLQRRYWVFEAMVQRIVRAMFGEVL